MEEQPTLVEIVEATDLHEIDYTNIMSASGGFRYNSNEVADLSLENKAYRSSRKYRALTKVLLWYMAILVTVLLFLVIINLFVLGR